RSYLPVLPRHGVHQDGAVHLGRNGHEAVFEAGPAVGGDHSETGPQSLVVHLFRPDHMIANRIRKMIPNTMITTCYPLFNFVCPRNSSRRNRTLLVASRMPSRYSRSVGSEYRAASRLIRSMASSRTATTARLISESPPLGSMPPPTSTLGPGTSGHACTPGHAPTAPCAGHRPSAGA